MRIPNFRLHNVGTPKAVRRVPVNGISLTGEFLGQEFESSLERDLLYLTYWDRSLDWFQVQPVTIEYLDSSGRLKSYTPDLLVSFNQKGPSKGKKPHLCEVKYKADLSTNWNEYYPKFKAAVAYARSQGWIFKIYTEDKIRIPLLANIKFLWRYQFGGSYPAHEERLLTKLIELKMATIGELIDACYPPILKTARGEALWSLWSLIANQHFSCDLSVHLSHNTKIHLSPNSPHII